jgi:DNA excision repair protein ERCC-4
MDTTLPTIIIDTREQLPLEFTNLPSQTGTLQSGDYSIAGLDHDFSIERKSIPDLCQSVTRGRERFERELHRLRGFRFARILIIGSPHDVQSHSQNPKAVFSSLGAFEARYGIPVVWEPSTTQAARMIERWAWFYHRERYGTKAACIIPPANVRSFAAEIV